MDRQRVAHVAQVDKLVDLPVGIAGDIDQRGFAGQAVPPSRLIGMMGNRLPERPVIQQRLEHGEVAEVLVAEAVLELADFLGDVGLALKLSTTAWLISQ